MGGHTGKRANDAAPMRVRCANGHETIEPRPITGGSTMCARCGALTKAYAPATPRAYVIDVDGTVTPYEPKNGTEFTLEELKDAIGGGWIEILKTEGGGLMVVDEEGKLKGFPPNMKATMMLYGGGLIVGKALVCERGMIS